MGISLDAIFFNISSVSPKKLSPNALPTETPISDFFQFSIIYLLSTVLVLADSL
jgi:hypothetical protein